MLENKGLHLISIIVPVYNGERTIQACIQSLLMQKYPNELYEIILVDNGSTDRTRERCLRHYTETIESNEYDEAVNQPIEPTIICHKASPVRYIYEPIRGSYSARNTGLKHAGGNIIAFTDADCIADKAWLKNAVSRFNDPSVGCVAGEIRSFPPQNSIEAYLAKRERLKQVESSEDFFLPYAKTANTFYRKSVFQKIGFFEGSWVSGGDADFSWRMQIETDYRIQFAPDTVIYHRHRSSITGLFKQAVRWGIGYKLLRRKYRDRIPSRTIKQSLWVFQRILLALIMLAAFNFQNKDRLPIEKRERYLDFISFMGWEIGKTYPIRPQCLNSVMNKFMR